MKGLESGGYRFSASDRPRISARGTVACRARAKARPRSVTPGTVKTSAVFVPGGFRQMTYVPRDELRLEAQAGNHLDERHNVISPSGPTRSRAKQCLSRGARATVRSGLRPSSLSRFGLRSMIGT